MFYLSDKIFDRDELCQKLSHESAGAMVVFEGWVRDHNAGKKVSSLEYQVYAELALKEGERILLEAKERFNLHGALALHRHGHLKLGEVAVWIGATATHRDDAFKATRFIIDEIKHRLPVWKKEHYVSEAAEWVFCRDHLHHVHFTEGEYYEKQNKLIDQQLLKDARVLVIGAGGLGCPVLTNLASAGIGSITIVDHDKISISNIHRQTLYSPNIVGEKKVNIAASKIKELNPFIKVIGIDSEIQLKHFAGHDVIIDCTDNMATKFFIHDAAQSLKIPLISASVFKTEGQIRTYLPMSEFGCARCQMAEVPDDALLGNCNDFGVLGVTTSIIGSLQAAEVLKFITTRTNNSLTHTLLWDTDQQRVMKINNKKSPECQTCQGIVVVSESDLGINVDEILSIHEILDIRNLSDDEVLSYKSQKSKLVLACHRGVRSKKLAQKMRESSQHEIYSLNGGACSH